MRIFAGVPLGADVKRHWVLSTTTIFGYLAGSGYVFENVRDTASNIIWRYATPITILQPLRFCGVLCIARSVIQPR